jgi:hypothetical protein
MSAAFLMNLEDDPLNIDCARHCNLQQHIVSESERRSVAARLINYELKLSLGSSQYLYFNY